MFPNPDFSQPQPKVIQFPFPEKAEDLRAVHIKELDKRFAQFMDVYTKTRTQHLTKFNYQTLQEKFVTQGGVSQEVFEKYLLEKGITWGGMKPLKETEREEKRKALFERYPPNIDTTLQ